MTSTNWQRFARLRAAYRKLTRLLRLMRSKRRKGSCEGDEKPVKLTIWGL